MKRSFIAMILSLTFSSIAFSEAPSFQSTTANVLAWNLAGFNAIPADKAATFAKAITVINQEAIITMEVNPDTFIPEIISEVKKACIICKNSILDQTARQRIAILYKIGVEMSNARLIYGSDNHFRQPLRPIFAHLKIRAGEPSRLLLCNFKGIYQGIRAGEHLDCQGSRDLGLPLLDYRDDVSSPTARCGVIDYEG